jgi:retron-type reverse transcriptase
VRSNKGARSAGVDGRSAYYIEAVTGVEEFLTRLRAEIKGRRFRPLPARERMIPKAGGKKRRLGIATITDRVVQGGPGSAHRLAGAQALAGRAEGARGVFCRGRCA